MLKFILCVYINQGVSKTNSKRQKLLTSCEHLPSLPSHFVGGIPVAHHCSFLCCVFVMFVFVFCLVCQLVPLSLDCPYLIAPGRWFSPGPLVSSTNKTDCHDKTKILLKVAIRTTKQTSNKLVLTNLATTLCLWVVHS